MALGKKTGGRKKGTSNKDTKPLKEMILGALSNVGGIDYLTLQAQQNPTAFLTLIGKVLPTTLEGKVSAGLTVKIVRFGDDAGNPNPV